MAERMSICREVWWTDDVRMGESHCTRDVIKDESLSIEADSAYDVTIS